MLSATPKNYLLWKTLSRGVENRETGDVRFQTGNTLSQRGRIERYQARYLVRTPRPRHQEQEI
jgi:hypothetical protein